MFQLETVDHVRPIIKVTANLQKEDDYYKIYKTTCYFSHKFWPWGKMSGCGWRWTSYPWKDSSVVIVRRLDQKEVGLFVKGSVNIVMDWWTLQWLGEHLIKKKHWIGATSVFTGSLLPVISTPLLVIGNLGMSNVIHFFILFLSANKFGLWFV